MFELWMCFSPAKRFVQSLCLALGSRWSRVPAPVCQMEIHPLPQFQARHLLGGGQGHHQWCKLNVFLSLGWEQILTQLHWTTCVHAVIRFWNSKYSLNIQYWSISQWQSPRLFGHWSLALLVECSGSVSWRSYVEMPPDAVVQTEATISNNERIVHDVFHHVWDLFNHKMSIRWYWWWEVSQAPIAANSINILNT